MAITIRPNKFLEHEISNLNFASDSGVEFEKDEFEIYFSKSKTKIPFNLKVTADLPVGWENAFTPPERANPPYSVVIAYISKDSRKRGAKKMSLVSGLSYEADLPIDFIDWRGKIELRIELIRNKGTSPTPGFYTKKYNVLSNSEEFSIYLEDKNTSPQGGELQFAWEDFTNDQSGALYYLDHAAPYSLPVLKLNSLMDDSLKVILEHKGHGERGLKRDLIWSPTEADIWEQIATKAFGILRDEGETFDLSDLPEPWNRVTKTLASMIFKGDQEDAEKSLVEICHKEDDDNKAFRNLLDELLPVAVQRKVNLLNVYEKLK